MSKKEWMEGRERSREGREGRRKRGREEKDALGVRAYEVRK